MVASTASDKENNMLVTNLLLLVIAFELMLVVKTLKEN